MLKSSFMDPVPVRIHEYNQIGIFSFCLMALLMMNVRTRYDIASTK